jgi:phasin family protein
MTTQKPFELTDLVKQLDPAVITEKYKVLSGKFRLQNPDTTALMEAQSANVQALTDANRAILQATQSLFQRQAEMVKQVLEEASEAVKLLASSANPQEAAEKEIELIEDSLGKALANFSEIGEMIRKTRDEPTKLVTDRFNGSLTELRSSIATLKAEAR